MAKNANNFALAASATAGLAYLICTALCYFWPQFSLDLMAPMVHQTDLNQFMPLMVITLRMTLLGLVQWVVYTYALVYYWVWLYNFLERA